MIFNLVDMLFSFLFGFSIFYLVIECIHLYNCKSFNRFIENVFKNSPRPIQFLWLNALEHTKILIGNNKESYNEFHDTINLSWNNIIDKKSSILHELGHAIDATDDTFEIYRIYISSLLFNEKVFKKGVKIIDEYIKTHKFGKIAFESKEVGDILDALSYGKIFTPFGITHSPKYYNDNGDIIAQGCEIFAELICLYGKKDYKSIRRLKEKYGLEEMIFNFVYYINEICENANIEKDEELNNIIGISILKTKNREIISEEVTYSHSFKSGGILAYN